MYMHTRAGRSSKVIDPVCDAGGHFSASEPTERAAWTDGVEDVGEIEYEC